MELGSDLGSRAKDALNGFNQVANKKLADNLNATLSAMQRMMAVYSTTNSGPVADLTTTMTSLQRLSARLDATLAQAQMAKTLRTAGVPAYAVLRPTAGGPAGAVGASFWSTQDQRGMLSVEGLPPLPVNQSYQLWLIDPKLPPINAGVLPDVATGGLRVQFGAAIRVESAQRFAISVEPRAGSTTPTRVVMASN